MNICGGAPKQKLEAVVETAWRVWGWYTLDSQFRITHFKLHIV